MDCMSLLFFFGIVVFVGRVQAVCSTRCQLLPRSFKYHGDKASHELGVFEALGNISSLPQRGQLFLLQPVRSGPRLQRNLVQILHDSLQSL